MNEITLEINTGLFRPMLCIRGGIHSLHIKGLRTIGMKVH